MTDQTPSGNRWEPTEPDDPAAPPVPTSAAALAAPPVPTSAAAPAAPADPSSAFETPPPAPAVPERQSRWRTLLHRPGRQSWLAAGASALIVFVGLGGFLAGRASVDEDPSPTEVGQQWRHGPGDGPDGGPVDGDQGELPPRPFDQDGGTDGQGPGGAPGTSS